MAASLSMNGYNMPTVVIQLILAHCDDSTLYAFMRTSRSYLKLATPILYDHITISSIAQLGLLKDCVLEQTLHADCPGTPWTRCFTLALHTVAAWSGPFLSSIQTIIDYLSSIPHTSERIGGLFPNLTKAYLYPIRGYLYYTHYPSEAIRKTFLSNVQHLHLLSDGVSGPFSLPNCHPLGIKRLRDIHVYDYHLAFDPFANVPEGGFWRFISQQPNLTAIHVYHQSQACLISEEAHPDGIPIDDFLIIPPEPPLIPVQRLHYDSDRIASLCGELAYAIGMVTSKDKLSVKESLFYAFFVPKLEHIVIKVPITCGDLRWESSNLLQRLRAGVELARDQWMESHSLSPAITIKIKWTQDQGNNQQRDMEAELPGIEDEPWRLSGLH